jgi:hypothetical protein
LSPELQSGGQFESLQPDPPDDVDATVVDVVVEAVVDVVVELVADVVADVVDPLVEELTEPWPVSSRHAEASAVQCVEAQLTQAAGGGVKLAQADAQTPARELPQKELGLQAQPSTWRNFSIEPSHGVPNDAVSRIIMHVEQGAPAPLPALLLEVGTPPAPPAPVVAVLSPVVVLAPPPPAPPVPPGVPDEAASSPHAAAAPSITKRIASNGLAFVSMGTSPGRSCWNLGEKVDAYHGQRFTPRGGPCALKVMSPPRVPLARSCRSTTAGSGSRSPTPRWVRQRRMPGSTLRRFTTSSSVSASMSRCARPESSIASKRVPWNGTRPPGSTARK